MFIKICVKPRAKKEFFQKTKENEYEISVREPAKNNLANQRVIEMVRENLGIKRGAVRIVSGHSLPSKIISVEKQADGLMKKS